MIFAFLYRKRGSHSEFTGTLASRLIWWVIPNMIVITLIAEHLGLPKWLALLSGLMCWAGISLGHGFAQGREPRQYMLMGLVCFTRLWMTLAPLIWLELFRQYLDLQLLLALPTMFLLSWGASAFSYSKEIQSHTLRISGVKWCVPGDSSWEELFIGFCYDLIFALLLFT